MAETGSKGTASRVDTAPGVGNGGVDAGGETIDVHTPGGAAGRRETPTYLPDSVSAPATGRRRLVRRPGVTRTFAIVPSLDDIEPPPRPEPGPDETGRALARHGAERDLLPLVTVSRQIVSATVTVTRGDEGGALVPAPHADRGGGALTGYGAPTLPPPRIEVERHPLPRVDPRLLLLARPDSAQAASFRSLRQRVIERGDPRCILVTSAAEKEGRTTCAANLALAFAEVRRFRVLLVEADVRAPSLASVFGITPRGSFLDDVEPPAPGEEAVFRVTEIEGRGLHVAVLDPAQKDRALDGPSFRGAIERLRRAYDYVVIDGPSVLKGPDVNLIEDSAEAILLAARARTSRGRRIRGAIEQIAPSNVLGVVLLDA